MTLWRRTLAVALLLVSVSTVSAQDTRPTLPTANETAPRLITNEWAVILTPGSDPAAFAARYGFELIGAVGSLPNTYRFRRAGAFDNALAAQLNDALEAAPDVLYFAQQTAVQQTPRALETGALQPEPITLPDPQYPNQWHLRNTGQFGGTVNIDANVVPAWDSGINGTGVTIGIVDDGLQHTHADLSANYSAASSYDFNGNDTDPSPGSFDAHGTSAGGVAAAGDNATCGVGSAYRAGLSGLRLIAGPSTDAMEASALTYAPNTNAIYSNSWGPSDNGSTLEGPGALTLAAFQNATTNGRSGRGSIYVWAAGNGRGSNDDVNADGYANSRYVIAVGAVDLNGIASWYSEPGAPMLVTAPSSGDAISITTTDLVGSNGYNGIPGSLECTNDFGGTSSATPLVSGVVALMLDANPNLGWRDVQHILAETAVKNHPADPGWTVNGAGYDINHNYGFGMVNASAAVTLATTWQNKPAEQSYTMPVVNVNQAIPDGSGSTSSNYTVSGLPANFVIEHVEVILNATHPYRGDLEIMLTAPSGTQSRLLQSRNDSGDNFSGWSFTSVRHWGEGANGQWTLRMSDLFPQDMGTFGSWQLIVHGYLRVNTNMLQNGDFAAGIQHWGVFALPDVATAMRYQITNGVFEFVRTQAGEQAAVLQTTSTSLPAGAGIEATFSMGNNSAIRRRTLLLIHNQNFSDTLVCSFWVPPNTAMQTYRVEGVTDIAWTSTTFALYASTRSDAGGYVELDNVVMNRNDNVDVAVTRCYDAALP